MILSTSLYLRLKAVAALYLKDMKGGSPYKLRVKNLSLGLVFLICLTIVIWAWEKTPVMTTTFIPPTGQFDMSSPVISVRTQPVTHMVHKNQKPSIVEVLSDQSPEKIPSQPAREVNLSARIKSEQGLGISPTGVTEKPSSDGSEDGNDLKMVTADKKECNYAKGKWVEDSRRPLYSGFGCKQWLSVMWSCRVNKRPDFAYENYRWQPTDCEMPEFEGSKFLRKMQDKTIAFVGDSLGRQQFQSLMCMVTGGRESPEVEDIGSDYGLIIPRGAKRPDGWAFRFPSTNTTILYYWSASLCALEPINRTDPHTNFAMHLDQPVQFLQQFLHRFDILVLNTGHHWNRGKIDGNRWVMYVNGVPNTDRNIAMIGNAKALTVHSVAKWLDLQLPRHPQLKIFFRTMAPRHFANGDWNTGGSCDSTTPLAGGSEVTQDGSADPVTEDAVKGTRVKLLDITALSQLRDEGHIANYSPGAKPGMYDCLHWCLPGIPDTWNEIFAAQV